jgi:hypothetical protein
MISAQRNFGQEGVSKKSMILRMLGVENDSDLYARSSLCVSMLLNLGKWTFRLSCRMPLNAVESIWQENIRAHLIYGSLF